MLNSIKHGCYVSAARIAQPALISCYLSVFRDRIERWLLFLIYVLAGVQLSSSLPILSWSVVNEPRHVIFNNMALLQV